MLIYTQRYARIFGAVVLLLCSTICMGYNFHTTSAFRAPAPYSYSTSMPPTHVGNFPSTGERIPTTGLPSATFQGGRVEWITNHRSVIYTPFTNNPINNNSGDGGGSNNTDDEEEVIPGTPSDPIPPTEYPIGESWILLLFAAASAALIYIKNKTLTSEKH